MKTAFDANSVVQALRDCLPADREFIGLHEPYFAGNEWVYVKECIDTRWVSSVGKFIDRFEQDLQEYTTAKRAVAVVNGTAALHIGLNTQALEIHCLKQRIE